MKTVLLISIVLVVIAVVIFGVWLVKGTRHLTDMQSAFRPNPANKNLIEVIGWHENELDKILADFRVIYGLPASAFVVTRFGDDHLNVSFPDDIEPTTFCYLVNYIRYPKDLDLHNRRIGVVGLAKLSRAFGIPDSSLDGLNAKIYVPSKDKEFDNVYVQLETGKAFKIPFTRFIWESVADPRVPDEIRAAP